MVRTTVKRLSVAVAVACVLVSCSADAGPRSTPPPTVSPSPSPTTPTTSEPTREPTREPTNKPTGPSEPELPPAAKAPGTEGAGAFVRYYIKLLNYAGATGEVGAFTAAASGCRSCKDLADNFRSTYRKGGYYRTDGWRVEGLVVTRESGHRYVALAQVKETPIEWRKTADSGVQRLDAGRLHLRFEVSSAQGPWQVRELTRS